MNGKFSVIMVTLFWIAAGIYFGSAGVAHHQLNQKPKVEANDTIKVRTYLNHVKRIFNTHAEYEQELKMNQVLSTFPWLENIPEFLILLLASCSMSGLGGIMRILYTAVKDNIPVATTRYKVMPLFASLLGVVVISAAYLFPAAIIDTGDVTSINPTSIIFFSLFAGYTAQKFLDRIEGYIYKA